MSEPIEICCKCGQDIRMTKDSWERNVHLSDPTFSGMPMPVGGYFYHKRCPDMSETKENLCPECGHPAISHCNPTEINIPGCLQHISVKNYGSQRCPCTRTYESLVGEKATSWTVRTAPLSDIPELEVSNTKPEPSLSLLVIDLGYCCAIKVEKGLNRVAELQLGGIDTTSLYGFGATISRLTFTELRSAIDGEKPVPRIETELNQSGYTDYILRYKDGDTICVQFLTQSQFTTLSELAGKPLPIYECGKWERLDGKFNPMDAYGELPVKVWRYRRD